MNGDIIERKDRLGFEVGVFPRDYSWCSVEIKLFPVLEITRTIEDNEVCSGYRREVTTDRLVQYSDNKAARAVDDFELSVLLSCQDAPDNPCYWHYGFHIHRLDSPQRAAECARVLKKVSDGLTAFGADHNYPQSFAVWAVAVARILGAKFVAVDDGAKVSLDNAVLRIHTMIEGHRASIPARV